MKEITARYTYKGKDISFLVISKIARIVDILARRENKDWNETYAEFLASDTYRALADTRSVLWYENAEFIVDEFDRERGKPAQI
jgi:hypothetical protein